MRTHLSTVAWDLHLPWRMISRWRSRCGRRWWRIRTTLGAGIHRRSHPGAHGFPGSSVDRPILCGPKHVNVKEEKRWFHTIRPPAGVLTFHGWPTAGLSVRERRYSDIEKHYRRFLYIDSEEVINAAAVLAEGEELELLRTTTKSLGTDLGVKFTLFGGGINVGGKGGRETMEQLKLRRTVHVQVDHVLEEFRAKKQLAVITSPADVDELYENLLLECDVDLGEGLEEAGSPLRPEQQQTSVSRRLTWGGWRTPAVEEVKKWEHHLGPRRHLKATVLDRDMRSAEPGDDRSHVLLLLETRSLLVRELSDFCRRATVVGQVWRMAAPGHVIAVANGRLVETEPPRQPSADVATVADAATTSANPPDNNLSQMPAAENPDDTGRRRWWQWWPSRAGMNDNPVDRPATPTKPDTPDDDQARVLIRPLVIFK